MRPITAAGKKRKVAMKIVNFIADGLRSIKGTAICIVCNETTSVLKESSIKRHDETKHASQFSGVQCQLRRNIMTWLQNHLAQQKFYTNV
jgi:hypothetical protein